MFIVLQVIFYEQDWNPQVDKQALQRAHRIGQINHVLSINLVTSQTVEEVRFATYCIKQAEVTFAFVNLVSLCRLLCEGQKGSCNLAKRL